MAQTPGTIEVTVVNHPLIADSLTRIRDVNTPNALFRQELERVGTLLLAEATRDLPKSKFRHHSLKLRDAC
jgi:uracil phosphoribosyltransferase